VTEKSLSELSKYNINYLIVWNPENWKTLGHKYEIIYADSVNDLMIKVYDLKKIGNK
jgi:hypothetical protein